MKKFHELHRKDGGGAVDIKKCKQNIAILLRPTYSVLRLIHSIVVCSSSVNCWTSPFVILVVLALLFLLFC